MKNQTIISLLCCLLLFVTGCSTSHQGNTYDIMTYGAKGDGQTDDAAAIQRAINACSAAGGGTVIIPAGHTFLCGPLYLKSYVNLHLEPNSRLLANPDESIYTESAFRENRGEGMMWISGKDLKQISITGTGEIDGNGIAFMGKELDDSYELKPVTDFDPRPHVLTLINVEKTVIRDITIRNSAYWTIHLIGCYDALIDGISLLNNLKIRNGDGIDVDHSKKVRIANCFIESGDDCICLKNRREFEEYGSCEDIVVYQTFSGRDQAGAIRPNEFSSLQFDKPVGLYYIQCRNSFCDTNYQSDTGIGSLHNSIGSKACRYENNRCIGLRSANSLMHGVEYRKGIVYHCSSFAG